MTQLHVSREMIEAYSKPVPRYTSFPTAPHFDGSVDGHSVSAWLRDLPDAPVSLYLHIPYCDRLCWFCGCHTKHTKRYEPVERYVGDLCREIALYRRVIGRRLSVREIHLGGGSPSLLRPKELQKLRAALDDAFEIGPKTQISVEFDPTDLSLSHLEAFRDFGVNRASLGVQDFNPTVQTAINRPQGFAETLDMVDALRDAGVTSINIDALYGLPFQTLDTLETTLEQVMSLAPDRIALFGYAHVPWVKPHQKLIPEEALPDRYDRFWQARFAEQIMSEYGLRLIGMDHFAKPDDSLTIAYDQGRVRRNFQGYTTDGCPTLIGLGVSSVSQYPSGYAQSTKSIHDYRRSLDAGRLPIEKGIAFSGKNMAWGAAIEALMTYFKLDPAALKARFGTQATPVLERAAEVARTHPDGFLVKTRQGYRVTPKGRFFIRSIAAEFDPYLRADQTQYSAAV